MYTYIYVRTLFMKKSHYDENIVLLYAIMQVKDGLSGFPDIELLLGSGQVVMVDAVKVAPIVLDHHCKILSSATLYGCMLVGR